MTRSELEHAIRASCEVSEDSEVYVIGSQAILGQFPNAPEDLRQSMEADVVPKNKPENADYIDGSLGEFSKFHVTHKFYVHGLSIEAAVLPDGWKDRVIKVQNENTRMHTGWCVEGHDMAASKLAASRPKDLDFVRILLREKLITSDELLRRVATLTIDSALISKLNSWISLTVEEM